MKIGLNPQLIVFYISIATLDIKVLKMRANHSCPCTHDPEFESDRSHW